MPDSPAKSSHRPGQRVSVLLALPLPTAYDYRVGEDMMLNDGDFVRVPLGRREIIGVVWGAGSDDIEKSKVKDVLARLSTSPMSNVTRQFVDWVAAYTVSPPGSVLKMAMSVPAALEEPKPRIAYGLNPDPPDFKMTKARGRVIDVLKDGQPPRPGSELAREAAVGTSVVNGLVKTGALLSIEMAPIVEMQNPDGNHPGHDLSKAQAQAGDVLAEDVAIGGFSVSLLDGVPGSGKTEVYFQAVAEALKQGRQVLVLLPEIALSAQWLGRFENRFGAAPVEWHSDLTPARRRDTWRAVSEGQVGVVVGARSALFLPYKDLALIVVDEEHEGAFKQEEGVIYNARDMAVVRAHLGDIPIVLASATPSLETVVNAKSGRYRLLHLPERHGGAQLPDISLIDMRADAPSGGRWLSPMLIEQLKQTFAAGEQAMLFLNRRGYAPLTLCRTCGHRFQCPNCTAWLVSHRRGAGRMQCHHCGYSTPMPESCPECEKDTLAACGPGVERLAEEVVELFPNIRSEIAASDSIASPAAAAELVRRIECHEIDLIIGTQIVAKGYHFPLLTLVGVVDADLGLTGGDLRAAERTYQLLYQVAGRAGRAERPGRVALQTYMPEHPVMQALLSGDRERFIEIETTARRESDMPPFSRLAALIVSGPDSREVDQVASGLAKGAPRFKNVLVLGPAPAPLSMVRGRHRRRFLIRAPKEVNMQRLIADWLSTAPVFRKVRIQADIDPYSFL
jgi:primosomal protein N' (replication factor Y) (superfamily II helicase)